MKSGEAAMARWVMKLFFWAYVKLSMRSYPRVELSRFLVTG